MTASRTYEGANGEPRTIEECTVNFVSVMPKYADSGLDSLSRFPNVRDDKGIDVAFDDLGSDEGELPF